MVRPALDVAQLTVSERLELIEALWDSLRRQPGALPLSDEERTLLAERRAEHRRDPAGAIPWDVVRADLWRDQRDDESAEGTGERGA